MAKKLNFAEAKSKFRTDDEAIAYFILVESYEKYLTGRQKEDFLSAGTIDDMIKTLDEKQLQHLKSLVSVFYDSKYNTRYSLGEYRRLDTLSDWFKTNIYENPYFSEETIPERCRELSKTLIDKIKDIWAKRLEAKKYTREIFNQYKAKLSKFGRNSVEYRQWLALVVYDHGMPGIDTVHDVTKLLRRLPVDYLKKLDGVFYKDYYVSHTIYGIKNIEPYLYSLVTSDVRGDVYSHGWRLNKNNSEYKAFQVALGDLDSKIKDILEEKGAYNDLSLQIKKILKERGTAGELISKIKKLIEERGGENKELADRVNDKFCRAKKYGIMDEQLIVWIKDMIFGGNAYIYDKIDSLKSSPMFYEDLQEILRAVGGDEKHLGDAISEYSRPGASGSQFNDYLRKAVLLDKVSKAEITDSDKASFRNKMLKVQKYFLDHITSRKYTVYRGMKFDGLIALLKTANPKLKTNITKYTQKSDESAEEYRLREQKRQEQLIKEINKVKPVVFDEGFVSTSLIENISAQEFRGRMKGSVFFTIDIPPGSKALVLDYEGFLTVPREEEVLLAERTRIKINSIKEEADGHYEIDAEVVK